MIVILMVLGLALLVGGAEVLVRGASGLARVAGLPPLIIGLTVVAYGTSAPELAVSLSAGITGRTDIALGNVVGSNTFNVLFILGVSGLIMPLVASRQLVRLDVPIMIGASVLTWWLARNGVINRTEGVLLVGLGLLYTAWLVVIGKRQTRRETADRAGEAQVSLKAETGEVEREALAGPNVWRSGLMILVGLGLLVLGSRWLVEGAVAVAQYLGASDLLIGLTIVAAGTSMPEVATSVMASVRGQRDMAIGNVVGSNIFNLLIVLGASSAVGEMGTAVTAGALRFDLPVMVAVAVVCLPIFFTGGRINRGEAGLLLGFYVLYVTFLILVASQHETAQTLSVAVRWFVVPLTVLALGWSLMTALASNK